jgi:DNA repair exonuclease SbcCD nuclease subunit
VVVRLRGRRVAFAGFPYHRRGVREAFPGILETTGWRKPEAEIRILCMHHCVEGARVGPSDFTFRGAPDVIRCRDLPSGFAAVVSGHIHRHQVLRRDLEGRSLPTPVFYPGSVERTAFAEAGERKGFVVLTLPEGPGECLEPRGEFVPLSARPMVARDLRPPGGGGEDWEVELLTEAIRTAVARVPRDAVLRLRVQGSVPPDARVALSAPRLRTLAPETMNVEALILEDRRRRWGRPNRWERRAEGRGARSGHGAGPPGRDARPQLQLPLELD